MLATALFLGFNSLVQTARLEDIYASWAQAQKGMTSLVVEFDYERTETIRQRKHQGRGRSVWSAARTAGGQPATV